MSDERPGQGEPAGLLGWPRYYTVEQVLRRPDDAAGEQAATHPNSPAEGRNGRWVRLGRVGVDSASIAITDLSVGASSPALLNVGAPDSRYAAPGSEFAGDWGTGIRFWAGFGDGSYDVWAWVVDYGTEGEPDERVAQVVMTLIDETDLTAWHED